MNCKYCDRKLASKAGKTTHERFCSFGPSPQKGWINGLRKETDPRVAKQGRTYSKNNAEGKHKKYVMSADKKKKLSELAKQRNLGGYRPHPNRGEYYKDTWFDSKWEVSVAKSLDENSVKWVRPKQGFVWTDKGNRYFPDFYLPEHNVYLDPKNDYLMVKDREKIDQAQTRNSIRVILLDKDHLEWNKIKELLH